VWFFGENHLAHVIIVGELTAGATLSHLGTLRAEQFFAGYLIEKALAIDNLFTIAALFTLMGVPRIHQHKVLFYGIIGALVMRACFIFAGAALIQRFSWIIVVFGVILLWTGIKMLFPQKTIEPEQHWLMRFFRRLLPVTDGYRDGHFFVRENGRRMVTPLFLAVVMIEFTDLIFAVDSIPAVLAITDDVFIVYSANVFAILGLRSLYFAVSGMITAFAYLTYALAGILIFVGIKMLLHLVPIIIPIEISLCVIIGLLVVGIAASLLRRSVPTPASPPSSAPRTSSQHHL
jgi:tellurite resistance protein TerC